jgi:trans,polycis-polyprenyl diphosphate synthase
MLGEATPVKLHSQRRGCSTYAAGMEVQARLAPAAPPDTPADLRPRHVAVAMDGNGRWARARGLPRSEGHRAGADRLTELVDGALAVGLSHVSAYGFSTENWKRSPEEVANLMTFTVQALRRRLDELVAKGVRVRWSGRPTRLRRSVIRELLAAEEATRHNQDLTLYLCVNYGGKAEIADATAAIARSVAGGHLRPADITEATIAGHLYQPDAPDVELFLRPSGERRTSNFLTWELAFAEMVFMDVLWPDFSREHLWRAVEIYAERQRRADLR